MPETNEHISPPEFGAFDDFDEATLEALNYLKDKFDYGLWMVTRTVGNDWIVLKSKSDKYDVSDGDVFRWDDSFCYHMVQGNGPNIAPNSDAVEAYANAPIGKQVPIKSYVGYPLHKKDGSLFGTLCAIDPETKPPQVLDNDTLFKSIAGHLSSVISGDMSTYELKNRIDQIQGDHIDPQTGLINKAGWDSLKQLQEEKKRKFGEPAAVIKVGLEDSKTTDDQDLETLEKYIQETASILNDMASDDKIAARLGENEFGILVESETALDPSPLIDELQGGLDEAAINAVFGWAGLGAGGTLDDAMRAADEKLKEAESDRTAK